MVKKFIFSAILLLQVPLWADPPAAPAATVPAKPAMNEMSGTVLEVDSDAKVLRLTLEGGYNVEFSYDSQTTLRNGGHDITVKDLGYGDQVTVRYIGKDLTAREIERTHKAATTAPSQSAAPTEAVAPVASAVVETPPSALP